MARRLTTKQEDNLLKEAYENFPEASMCLRCLTFNYKRFIFEFQEDDGEVHIVTLPKARKGLRLFIEAVDSGKLPGLALPADYLTSTGLWDAWAFDALNQMAIYGEVIFG